MQLKLNEIEPDDNLLYKPHVAVEFLVNMDALDIIGGAGMYEHFNTSHAGDNCNAESCATAFIIWLMDALLKTEGNPFYGDIMERSIYNALFAASSPAGDSIRYFTDYESAKEYYPVDYFCCPNNYRRIIADLHEFVYYRSKNGIAVNLYNTSSVLFEINNNKVEIHQVTDYPSSGNVKIRVEAERETEFELKLRIPLWTKGANILVNGIPTEEKAQSGAFFAISKKWKKGDEVEISFPMEYRFVRGRGQQWDKVALMRGPVVYGISNVSNPSITEQDVLTIDPETISEPISDESFRPGGLKCTFQTTNKQMQKVTFTEFIDPSGIKTFFYVSENSQTVVNDELVAKQY
jgi:DUF1680 family protein